VETPSGVFEPMRRHDTATKMKMTKTTSHLYSARRKSLAPLWIMSARASISCPSGPGDCFITARVKKMAVASAITLPTIPATSTLSSCLSPSMSHPAFPSRCRSESLIATGVAQFSPVK
jgi:hypothetical protein